MLGKTQGDNVLTQMSIISRGKGGEDKRRNVRLDENWRAKSVTTVAALRATTSPMQLAVP